MDIKKLNEEIKSFLEADWSSFADHSLPNGDKDDQDFEPVIIDKGTITINIFGTDITYNVFEHKYINEQQDKLFGGLFIEAPNDVNNLVSDISEAVYAEINKQFEQKFDRKIDYENEPTFIKIPRHLVSHNN